MKSIKFFAVASAVALLSTTGFTSCNPKNGPEDPKTGNYNGEVVKTEFVINIPTPQKNKAMYMPSESVQKASNFLGMDDIVLIPYNTAIVGSVSDTVRTTDKRLGSNITLGNIASSGEWTSSNNQKVYSDVEIPLGTNHFLFYAHGTADASVLGGHNADFYYGSLTPAALAEETPENVEFSLKQIYAGTPSAIGARLADYLTHICSASDGTKTWAQSTNAGYVAMLDSVKLMTAGSSASVQAFVQTLYTRICKDTLKAGSANGLQKAILDSIITYKPSSTETITNTVSAGAITFNSKFNGYPQDLNLPDGAAAILWSTDKFIVNTSATWSATSASSSAASGSLSIANPASYVYPASIYYYVNSGLKTSTSKQSTNYNTYNYWADILANLYTGDIFVGNSTRSVAIKDSIQYGVANLVTLVKANDDKLNDNDTNQIDVTKLKMTAVLIGGQGTVKYDFAPTDAGTSIVYDSILTTPNQTLQKGTYTTLNTTLVLETMKDQNVIVAVEFLNDDHDFVGMNKRLIPKGTKFYLIGELKAADVTETALNHKIFKQDYTTTARFNLGSLKNAYNVVPDLRANELELGFSVDLTWQAGHTFDITF